jgi:hypothetical protein
VQSPYRFSDARSGVVRGPARLGEHDREVLTEWLGAAEAEIDGLERDGTLGAPEARRATEPDARGQAKEERT